MYDPSVLRPVASSDHCLLDIAAVDVEVVVVDTELLKQHTVICHTCAVVDGPRIAVAAVVGNDVAVVPSYLLGHCLVLEVLWVVDARTLRWVNGGICCMCWCIWSHKYSLSRMY